MTTWRKCTALALLCAAGAAVPCSALSFELAINGGYGFGAGGGQDSYSGQVAEYTAVDTGMGRLYTEYNDKYVSFGNGAKVDLTGTLYFNDNVGMLFGFGGSFGGGTKVVQEISYPSSGDKSEYTLDIKGNYLAVSLGLKVKGSNKVAPYAYLAPALVIPVGISAEGEDVDTDEPVET
ncbi:MAG: hypothetical protein GF331_22680, partial [Chitinivibrionales bacterium]|nr:hypothetical protein [Chitinivibrionales bacterium]